MTDQIPGELVHLADDEYSSFAAREPVVLTHLIAGPVVGLVTLFAPGAPASTAEQITAGAVALAVVLQGFVLRRYVGPAWKRFTGTPLLVATAHPRPYPHAD